MKTTSTFAALSLLATSLLATSCGGGAAEPPEYPVAEAVAPPPVVEEQSLPATEPAPPPPPAFTIRPAERTPIEGTAPTLSIKAPRQGQLLRAKNVKVRLSLKNWDLAPAPGKHVHVIVDNEPYIAIRDARKPLNLTELVLENLGHELAPGTHVLRLFPSRHNHESAKVGAPLASVVFHYKKKSEGWAFDTSAPLLTYSRPKGCNPSGTPVLVDFYLTNVDALSDEGYRVRYTIDGESGFLTDWVPHFVEGLADGEHTIQLQLVDAAGALVAGPFNDTTRTFTIADACS